ncbi:MAG: GAF and ANTAR domain-containing protein [Jatrophihabitans sp.]
MSTPQGITDAALTELAGLLMSSNSFEDLMQQSAELAARLVPAAATCGITMAADGRVLTVGSADALARLLDEQQYELDQGPCLEALSTSTIVSAPDLREEQRWDGYPTKAVLHGVCSIYSSPLIAGATAFGVLNLYAREPDAFDEHSRSAAALLARLTSTMITAAMRHYDEVTLSDHLRSALSSRSVIDQAMGIVIAMRHCTPKEAFGVLRTVSQHRNMPLREVAAEMLANSSNGSIEG